MSLLTSYEPDSLDIFCFIFSWPHHSLSLKHITLGFLNTGLTFPFSHNSSNLFLGSFSSQLFKYWILLVVSCFVLFFLSQILLESSHPVSGSHPPFPHTWFSNFSLQPRTFLRASVLCIGSWTFYKNLHILQPSYVQVVLNQKHYSLLLGKPLLPPSVFPLLVDIKSDILRSPSPSLSLIQIS